MFSKKNLSFSMLTTSSCEEKFLKYIERRSDAEIVFEYGKVLHSSITNEKNDVTTCIQDSYVDRIKNKAYLSLHDKSCAILLSESIKNSPEYKKIMTGENIMYEKRIKYLIKFKNRIFSIKAIPDIYNISNSIIIEIKTTSMVLRNIEEIIEKYNYDLQMYIYKNGLNNNGYNVNNIFICFGSKISYQAKIYLIKEHSLSNGENKFYKYIELTYQLLQKHNLIDKYSYSEDEYFNLYNIKI